MKIELADSCHHIFPDGHRCGSPHLRHETLCFYHHPTRRLTSRPRPRRSHGLAPHPLAPRHHPSINAGSSTACPEPVEGSRLWDVGSRATSATVLFGNPRTQNESGKPFGHTANL
jgi:hypothetical protein